MKPLSSCKKISIAFLGMPAEHKGWKQWEMMVENYKEDYRFVVFNSSDDEYQNMEKVKIQYSPGNLSAMTKALRDNALVSMNMWGLTPDFLDVLEDGFKEFFEKEVSENPLKSEYLIPIYIGELLKKGKMSVKVLKTNDTWYGMTYHEDVAAVKDSFKKMLENGVYKADLFSDL